MSEFICQFFILVAAPHCSRRHGWLEPLTSSLLSTNISMLFMEQVATHSRGTFKILFYYSVSNKFN